MRSHVPPIRVVMYGLPRLWCDLLRGILADESDIDLSAVDAWTRTQRVPAPATGQTPDVVVLALADHRPDETPALPHELLRRFPAMRIVAIEDRGRRASLYELRPCRLALGELTPESFVRAVRAVHATADDGYAAGVSDTWVATRPARSGPAPSGDDA